MASLSREYQSEAAGHFNSQNCVYPSTTTYRTYSPPRLRKVTTVTEYDDKGKRVKETKTEEWTEGGYHYPYHWYNNGGGITWNSNTLGTTSTYETE